MKKRLLRNLLCTFAVAGALTVSSLAYTENQLSSAQKLYDLGLLKGNSDTFSAESMDLDSYATRAQLAVTVTRMLGKESKAIYQQNAHPFKDVPSWASAHVGYLYENYLVNGVSDTYFAADDVATLNQFCAMLLRVLGYSEAEWDFTYDEADTLAVSLGLAEPSATWTYELTRGTMIEMCYKALNTNMKMSRHTLADRLVEEKVISKSILENQGIDYSTSSANLDSFSSSTPATLGTLTVEEGEDGEIHLYFPELVEEYGIRMFYTSYEHPTPTEIDRNEIPFGFRKGTIRYPGGSAAGYIDHVTLYGIPDMHDIQVIVLKTSSEGNGNTYRTIGKSSIVQIDR